MAKPKPEAGSDIEANCRCPEIVTHKVPPQNEPIELREEKTWSVSIKRLYRKLIDAGVEENGTRPVPEEERTETQYNNLFTVFFTGLLCVLPYVFDGHILPGQG